MKTDAQRYAESAKNLLLGTFTTKEIIDELVKRDGVKEHKIIPCEHYAVHRRHVIIEQGIGEATIIVVGKQV